MNDPWYPTEQRQNEAEKETRDPSGHQYCKRRKHDAEKISEGFHKLFLSLSLSFRLSVLFGLVFQQFIIFDHRI
jgi:hypothetical protein